MLSRQSVCRCRSCWISVTRWACLTAFPPWQWPPICGSCTGLCWWTLRWPPTFPPTSPQVCVVPELLPPAPQFGAACGLHGVSTPTKLLHSGNSQTNTCEGGLVMYGPMLARSAGQSSILHHRTMPHSMTLSGMASEKVGQLCQSAA